MQAHCVAEAASPSDGELSATIIVFKVCAIGLLVG